MQRLSVAICDLVKPQLFPVWLITEKWADPVFVGDGTFH